MSPDQPARDPRYDILFEPVAIGPKIAPNRFFQVPHCNGGGYRDPSAVIEMRRAKAEGGRGVIFTEQVEIHHTSEITPFIELRLWEDRDLPALARMAEAMKSHGALAGIELAYSGINGPNLYSREVPRAVSGGPILTFTADPVQARTLDGADIRDLRRWFRNAFLRSQRAGYGIVCLYGAHGLGIFQHFLSRATNRRSDAYGGSLQNRARFLAEVVEEGHEATRGAISISLRLSFDEAGTTLGGRVTAERALPGLAAWGRVADYRIGQITPLPNVALFRQSRLEVADILEIGADQVCIATGADWHRDVVARHHLAPIPTDPAMPIFTPDDLMAGRLPAGGHVVIYDDDHYYMGSVLAELLIAKGCRVTLLTPAVRVAEWTLNTLEQGRIQRRLMERGATLALSAAPATIGAGAVQVRCTWTGRESEIACDAVVLVSSRTPRDRLWHDLAAADWRGVGIRGIRRIGDAEAPAPIAWATYAGRRYAEEMDAPDRGDALPFRRDIVAPASATPPG